MTTFTRIIKKVGIWTLRLTLFALLVCFAIPALTLAWQLLPLLLFLVILTHFLLRAFDRNGFVITTRDESDRVLKDDIIFSRKSFARR